MALITIEKTKCGEIYCWNGGIYSFVCFLCDEEYDSAKNMIKHFEMHLGNEEIDDDPSPTDSIQTDLKNEDQLTIDSDSDSTDSIEIINENVDISKFLMDTFTDEIEMHTPSAKSEINESAEPLSRHNADKSESKSYENDNQISQQKVEAHQCSICGKTFYSINQLNEHIKQSHTNVKRYKCSMCYKTFSNENNLNQHEERHKNLPVQQCKICEKLFSSKQTLQQHMYLHRDEKTFKCRLCDMKFAQSAGRGAHEKKHHKNNII